MATRHHGITALEPSSGVIPMVDADTSTIGLLAFADDANAEFFPLDTPVLVTSITKAIGNAGEDGNLCTSLESIADICSPTLIIVRVASPYTDTNFNENLIIGSNQADDSTGTKRTGLNAFLTAKSITSLTPKIIITPDVETPAVIQKTASICKKLRAFAYVTPRYPNGEMVRTQEEVAQFRNQVSDREIMFVWPEWTGVSNNNTSEDED